jgi:hypothetical protein
MKTQNFDHEASGICTVSNYFQIIFYTYTPAHLPQRLRVLRPFQVAIIIYSLNNFLSTSQTILYPTINLHGGRFVSGAGRRERC